MLNSHASWEVASCVPVSKNICLVNVKHEKKLPITISILSVYGILVVWFDS